MRRRTTITDLMASQLRRVQKFIRNGNSPVELEDSIYAENAVLLRCYAGYRNDARPARKARAREGKS